MKLKYISAVVFLIIFCYVALNIPDYIRFSIAENPSMPCRIEDRYVVVTNTSFIPFNLEGWRLNGYTLPSRWIWPGQSIKLWRGSGTNDFYNLYADSSSDTWITGGIQVKGRDLFGVEGFHSFFGATCDLDVGQIIEVRMVLRKASSAIL